MPGSRKPSLPKSLPPARLAERTGPGAVVLDFDGTLAPLRRDPAGVRLGAGMRAALGALAAKRVVMVVSGRPLAFLEPVAGGLGLILVGSHGAESAWPGLGRRAPPRIPRAIERVVAAAESDGLRVERKPFGRSIHVRELAPAAQAAALSRYTAALRAALPATWALVPGRQVVEARPAGVHKGAVIAPLRQAAGLAAALGDDVTDEDLFRNLAGGELGVLVGRPRPSAARFRLGGIAGVRAYLTALAARDRR